MNVENPSREEARHFGAMCRMSEFIIGTEQVTEASPRKQRKFRKWVEQSYTEVGADESLTLSQDLLAELKALSNAEYMAFLQQCKDKCDELDAEREAEFEKATEAFEGSVREALRVVRGGVYFGEDFEISGSDLVVRCEFSCAYIRRLILKNVSGLPCEKIMSLNFLEGELELDDNGEYILSGEIEIYGQEVPRPVALRFSGAAVEYRVFKAHCTSFADTPWEHLSSIAADIIDKADIPDITFNPKERELLPLLCELNRLYREYAPEGCEITSFSVLCGYAEKYGYSKVVALLKKAEVELSDELKTIKNSQKATELLNHAEYEPLFRELYGLIADSQAEYSEPFAERSDPDTVQNTRAEIQHLMEQHGFSGQYPDFYKNGAIKGVKLTNAYGEPYFVGREKNVVGRIHCVEECFNGHLRIQFVCGTALLKKNETCEDIFACCFNNKGRRYMRSFDCGIGYTDENGETQSDDLELCVSVAVKKVFFEKLTKQEKELYNGYNGGSGCAFLFILVLGGGAFSLLLNGGLAILGALILLIGGQPSAIPEMFTEFQWGWMIAFAWLGFGLPMAVFNIFSHRR